MGHSVTIVVDRSPGEIRAAVVRNGVLEDYAIYRPGSPDGVGDLHRGRVSARVPAMAGAFVALAGAEGFLPDSEGGANVTEGQLLGVRITRAAQAAKGPRLTARLSEHESALARDGPVRLIQRGPTPVEEFARRHPEAPLTSVSADLHEQMEALASPKVLLPGGGRMRIEPTAALVAIDIDAGAATADRTTKTASQARFNRAVLPELARQIRLRNLSGPILVDFAGLSPRHRMRLEQELRQALAEDSLRPRLLGFTQLGLAEIVRPRIRPPLHELLDSPLAEGLAALRKAARELAAAPSARAVLRAAPPIIHALRADPVALPELAYQAAHPMILEADPSLRGWCLELRDARH